jgi:hypothetical protein
MHLLLSFKESFFFLTSNKLLNKCLKCLKRLEVLLGTFRKSTRTEQWPHSNDRLFNEAVPLMPGEISPSMYVRNLQQEKAIEKIFGAVRRECTEWDWKGAGAIPCPMEETERSIAPAKGCSLMQRDPDYWSAVPVRTQCVLPLLTSTWQSHVSL